MEEFTHMLKRKSERDALSAVQGYKLQAKHSGEGFDLKCNIKSRKPLVAIRYKKNKNAGFELHIRPLHVARYAYRFSELSERIRDCCINGRDCTKCGYCEGVQV